MQELASSTILSRHKDQWLFPALVVCSISAKWLMPLPLNGAFTNYVTIPSSFVYTLSDQLSDEEEASI